MRIVALLISLLISAPAALAAYTEVPPFSATQFARQRGVFRWYRGCWWRVVDPNVYLFCNNDGTIYLLLPDGTLRQILREDAERWGLDDSGARYFEPVRTQEDLRRIANRYTVPPQSVLNRYGNGSSSYGSSGRGQTAGGGGYYAGGDRGGTGVFHIDGTGGYFSGVGGGGAISGGGGSSGGSGGGGSTSGGGTGGSSGGSSGGGGGGGSTGGTGGSGGSSGGGGSGRRIGCSGPDDTKDGGVLGPIPCTWFPGVFGPIPDIWGPR